MPCNSTATVFSLTQDTLSINNEQQAQVAFCSRKKDLFISIRRISLKILCKDLKEATCYQGKIRSMVVCF